jgi:hypothetical protein
MPLWFLRLRDIVWPAVIAGVLAVVDIIVAIASPTNLGLILALGLSAVVSALLAQRA